MFNNNLKTLCVILHYGRESFTNECIQSIINNRFTNLDIIVSDNDPSQSYKLPENLNINVRIVKTGGNVGFAKGNNIGVNKFLSDIYGSILILSNDTILTKDSLDFLRKTLHSKKNIGAVGPCMPYHSNPNKIWSCGGSINYTKLKIEGSDKVNHAPYETDYLPGAALLCRSDIWKEIGGFNEDYFLAYEEAEFSLEIKKKGLKVIADPRSIVLHHVGMSKIRSSKYFYNEIRNRITFSKYIYGKKIGLVYAIIITFLYSLKAPYLKSIKQHFLLWIKAVIHELKNTKVTSKVLNFIEDEFKD